jgi:hypothetical protein
MRTSRTTVAQPRASSESPVLSDAPLRGARTAKLRAKQDIQDYTRNHMNNPSLSGNNASHTNTNNNSPGKFSVFDFRNSTPASTFNASSSGSGTNTSTNTNTTNNANLPQSPTRSSGGQLCKGCGNALQGAMSVNTQTGQPRVSNIIIIAVINNYIN